MTYTQQPTYPYMRYLMDEWLVANRDFLEVHGVAPVTREQMRELRAACCELIRRPLDQQPPVDALILEARRSRYQALAHLYYLVCVGECLGVPVDQLLRLERGDVAQMARYRELIDTYEERIRYRPALVADEDAGDRPFHGGGQHG